MDIQEVYNTWADTYDTVRNRIRDLEARFYTVTGGIFELECCVHTTSPNLRRAPVATGSAVYAEMSGLMRKMKSDTPRGMSLLFRREE